MQNALPEQRIMRLRSMATIRRDMTFVFVASLGAVVFSIYAGPKEYRTAFACYGGAFLIMAAVLLTRACCMQGLTDDQVARFRRMAANHQNRAQEEDTAPEAPEAQAPGNRR